MGMPETPNPPHLYSQALQLKLYQAFIFSIPILFSIILFLLFYLFYLKRRAASSLSSLSTPRTLLPLRSFNHTVTYLPSAVCHVAFEEQLKHRLKTVLFNEELRSRDSQCCVCLGEFQIKEELLQIPSCKHVFHGDCIHHWLLANSTCPLCRCFVIPTIKLHSPGQFSGPETDLPIQQQQQQQQHQQQPEETAAAISAGLAHTLPSELSSSVTIITDATSQEAVAINIQTQNS